MFGIHALEQFLIGVDCVPMQSGWRAMLSTSDQLRISSPAAQRGLSCGLLEVERGYLCNLLFEARVGPFVLGGAESSRRSDNPLLGLTLFIIVSNRCNNHKHLWILSEVSV